MTSATVVWRNLGRNKARTALTVASIAISLFLFTLLRAVVDSMHDVAASSAAQLRLVVHHKTTMTKMLPVAHAARIAELPGVDAVCPVRWYGGRLADSNAQFPSLAADPAAFPRVYQDFALRGDELDAWGRDRTAAIIGAGLAERMGWTRGQRVALRSSLPPYLTLEFRVVGITAAPAYPNLFVFRLDYLLDAIRDVSGLPTTLRDTTNFFWVKAADTAALDAVRPRIDELFAQSPNPTRTEPEEAFVAQFTQMFGDIPRIVSIVGLIVVASIALVASNTMSMSIRERSSELAVLRAIGFSGPRLLATVLGEAALLGVIGGAVGALPALLISGRPVAAALGVPFFPILHVPPAAAGVAIVLGAVLGVLAGLAPAGRVARLSVTTTLREKL